MSARPETDVIIFYDIPSTVPGKAWSPNTWKTRYLLNFKGLPYRTQWVEYPDIAPLMKSYGLPPNPAARTSYTLPAIYDPRTKRAIMDSVEIAKYLDDEYPETHAVIPKKLRPFQAAFDHAFLVTVLRNAMIPLFIPRSFPLLNPASQPYWRRTREEWFNGTKLEDVCPPPKHAAQWLEIKNAYGDIAKWLDSAGDGRITFIGGSTIEGEMPHVVQADITIAAALLWMRIVCGRDSDEWKAVEKWHDGRWRRLLDLLEPYSDCSR